MHGVGGHGQTNVQISATVGKRAARMTIWRTTAALRTQSELHQVDGTASLGAPPAWAEGEGEFPRCDQASLFTPFPWEPR